MDFSQIIYYLKISYHLLAAVVLFYILYKIEFKQFLKGFLFLMMLLHFYDCYWFYANGLKDAPI